ncbi:unnamed protein product [Clonostachys rosea]|uniref:Uncharacterized protein n=1 Tax=Bionectria ochroleuca TaxID=29856 RepID=A0ABY6UMC3_BIOOC|nr:unnamed protein product [Clonostachys rosea]
MAEETPNTGVAWEHIKGEKDKVGDAYYKTSDSVAAELHKEMVGKTVIITGVTSGSLGADAARVIAAHEPKLLILASRSESAIAKTIEEIKPTASVGTRIEPLIVDLGDQLSVRAAAKKVLELTSVVDVLINSAALMMIHKYTQNADGVEMHLAINHLGHFLFTNLIMPALLKSDGPSRVVTISAAAHRIGPFRFSDYNFAEGEAYDPLLGYAQSKCANLLFALSLAQKLGHKNLLSYGVDPGGSITNLFYRAPKEELIKHGWLQENGEPSPGLMENVKSVEQAVASYIVAAYSPDIKGRNGCTITGCIIDDTVAEHAKDPEAAEQLWNLSEQLVGQKFNYLG